MSIDQAAELLQEKLREFDWLTAVAVGGLDDKEVIFVYLKRAVRHRLLDSLKTDGWHGYEVKIERVGKAKAVA